MESNAKIVDAKPLKKSKYTSIIKLEKILADATQKNTGKIKVTGKDVKVISFEESIEKNQKKIKQILLAEEQPKDQFEAKINSEFSSGNVIIIGPKSEGKITIEYEPPTNSICKNIYIIESKNHLTITQKIKGKKGFCFNETIFLEEESKTSIMKINENTGEGITNQQIILQSNSEAENINTWFEGTYVRAKTSSVLEGNGASIRDYVLLIGKEKEHFDLNYISVHRGEGCYSHAIFKAALMDNSKNVFDGMIKINPTGTKTNALLECHSMILGENASSNQIPGLEIKTDDVKATHSATVARINDDELFYLEARGISKEQAKKMIITGFLENIVFKINENQREELQKNITKKV